MSSYYLPSLESLVEHFESLPSIGHKSAQRLAYFILKMPEERAKSFAKAIVSAKENIHYCKRCCNFTDKEFCNICDNKERDSSIICVVEDPKDISAIERTQEFNAVYHVLHGVISPLNGIGRYFKRTDFCSKINSIKQKQQVCKRTFRKIEKRGYF